MTQSWKVTDGIYRLLNPKNRGKLEDHFTELLLTTGKRPKVKGLLIGKDKKPYRLSTASMDKVLSGEEGAKVKLKPKRIDPNRPLAEVRPGAVTRSTSRTTKATEEITQQFIDRVSGIEGSTPEKIQRYFEENNQALRKLRNKIGHENKKILESGKGLDQRLSRGHDARLSKSIDSPRNIFIELLTENIAKGDNYSANPMASLAIGNPVKEGRPALENWALDYTTWLDKPENGGTGVLAQRGDYNDLLEQKFRSIGGEQWEKLTPQQKLDATNQVDDLIHESEKLNQFLPSEGESRRKFGLLLPDQAEQAKQWVNTDELRKLSKTPQAETLELGRPLGGIGDKLQIGTGKTRKLDAALNIGANLAAGNTAGAAVQAGMLGTTEALKNKAVQKAMARQIAKIAAKRGSKSALKLIPGVDIGLSAKEAWDYATQGKWDQAGIAAASGAVGWVPGIGDAISAGLDLTNTGIDVSRMQLSDRKGRKNKTDVEAPTRRMKFKNL